MESRANVLDRFNIHQRTNSFLSANNLKLLDTSTNLNCNGTIFSKYFRKEGEVAPITIAHLDNLYNSTIFLSVKTHRNKTKQISFFRMGHLI